MTCYHVTKKENLPSILRNGLIPQIDERARDCGERCPYVFLFPSEEDKNTALSSWLGLCFNEEEELVSLKLDLPEEFPIKEGEAEFEVLSELTIPSRYIVQIKDE